LQRLAAIAKEDRKDLFRRRAKTGRLYKNRLFAVALCQGAALHYLNLTGANGIKDFDVWSFFEEHPERPFPYRRTYRADFGDDKFGKTEGFPHFRGRVVDLIGRSMKNVNRASPVDTLRRYLRQGAAKRKASRMPWNWHLAQKAVILIEPDELLGTIVWPEKPLTR